MNKYLRLLLSIGLCEGAGIVGAFFTNESVRSWYPTLTKPFFNPPSWIFGLVWTVLYLLMGISLYLVWGKKVNLKWFWAQLVLNTLWSIVFFGLKSPELALVVIVGMWISILFTILAFWKINRLASYLLIPYLLWVTFATMLNLSIAVLN